MFLQRYMTLQEQNCQKLKILTWLRYLTDTIIWQISKLQLIIENFILQTSSEN